MPKRRRPRLRRGARPTFRFYALYDKVYRKDVLWFALRRCRNNGGVPGVDDQTFADIDEYGEGKWLEELAEELRTKTYQPCPVRRAGGGNGALQATAPPLDSTKFSGGE